MASRGGCGLQEEGVAFKRRGQPSKGDDCFQRERMTFRGEDGFQEERMAFKGVRRLL